MSSFALAVFHNAYIVVYSPVSTGEIFLCHNQCCSFQWRKKEPAVKTAGVLHEKFRLKRLMIAMLLQRCRHCMNRMLPNKKVNVKSA
jgi:hypothetical protein